MKPIELLGETRAPDGTLIALTRQDREFIILAGGKPLMSSRMHGSEQALATFGCRHVPASEGGERLLGPVHAARHQRLAAGEDDELAVLPRECDQRTVRGPRLAEQFDWFHRKRSSQARRDGNRSRSGFGA